ncbi:hypothetical protein BWD13_08795 [Leptospira santarosai serovar Grippotyphosa]|nr:hypothetical protein BWD13_08795 [Leptospira santarosai serovar Grippotyphosa]
MFKKHTNLWIAHLCFAKSLRLRSAICGYLALYGSLIFALQRAFDYAPLSAAISLSMDRSSLLCKEPSITLRYLRLSRSLWIAHLCFAKSLRLRSAICGYLALYGSLDRL